MATVNYDIDAQSDTAMSDANGYQEGFFNVLYVDDNDGSGGWYACSFRFYGINLGGSPTINSATLTLARENDNSGSNGVLRCRAEASQTPATFSSGNRPYSRSHRSAYVEHTFPNNGTTQNVDVTSIVQDLVSVYSYNGGSDAMVFTFGGSHQWGITSVSWRSLGYALNHASGVVPRLTIDYSTGPTVIDLAGTIAGQSTTDASLGLTKNLAGTSDAVSTVSGTLQIVKPLAGAIASVSTIDGTLQVVRSLAGSVDAASSVSGSVGLTFSLVGPSNAVSAIDGVLSVGKALAGSIDAVSSISGTLGLVKNLSGSVDAQSGVSGTASIVFGLSGSFDAASAISGSLGIAKNLAGSIDAQSTVSGSLGLTLAIAGAANAVSDVSGTLSVGNIQDLAGAVDAQSSFIGDLTVSTGIIPIRTYRLDSGKTIITLSSGGRTISLSPGRNIIDLENDV